MEASAVTVPAIEKMGDPGPRPYPKYYSALVPQFIRVFELEAGDFSDPIVGRLVPQPIDGEPYEAISYVWGDTRDRRDITIQGKTLSVTASLHAALTAFRHLALSDSAYGSDGDDDTGGHAEAGGSAKAVEQQRRQQPVRRLWADAVCINQEDLDERTSQVELMGRIFAGAHRVLAWMGWEKGVAGRHHMRDAIRFIHDFMKDPEGRLVEARILLHHDPADAHATGDLAGGTLALLSEEDRGRYREQARRWSAVKFLFKIEYFHRAWIVQELGLAREASLYTALWPSDTAEGRSQPLELHSVGWPLLGRFVKFLDYNAASLVTHLGLLLWVAHHILMIWEVKNDGTPDCDFLTGMHWARILGVTDPRDRVYSLLGHPLAVMDGVPVIKPDYTVTRGIVYTKLAVTFIQKTRNLYVTTLVDHEEDVCVNERHWDPEDEGRMPSWVPDWHSINRTTPLSYSAAPAQEEDDAVRIQGDMTGTKGMPMPHLLVRGWVVDEIAAVSHRMETADFPVTNLAREQAKKNPFWLDRLWQVVFPADGRADRSDALEVLESLSLALPLGTREKDEPMTTAGTQQTRAEHRRSFAAYVLEYHELRRSVPGSHDGAGRPPARSLLETLPPDAQAEVRRRAHGATGERFVECMTWPSMCRVAYRTASGLVGLGSRVTRPGDLVCRVRGSPVLMTLRRVRDVAAGAEDEAHTISCAHVAPTIVPARMIRGVTDGGEFGERPARFRII
ncbi:hypothetical protein PpBr36_01993 [Pyricularia pennisetigena]|uniref:hypothetical protein n=1 Tax=Pyricularia pennisetigena TaxID=1578925 RepID=UPI00114F2395|nr:hypothetical protein PpBr36_01993 [Pyricularia pennisetigena]TLS29240.1 hypothetical protein PpBr36_01993 [Pyricularia pennisetigena]